MAEEYLDCRRKHPTFVNVLRDPQTTQQDEVYSLLITVSPVQEHLASPPRLCPLISKFSPFPNPGSAPVVWLTVLAWRPKTVGDVDGFPSLMKWMENRHCMSSMRKGTLVLPDYRICETCVHKGALGYGNTASLLVVRTSRDMRH